MSSHDEHVEEEETPWLSFSDAVTALLFIFIATTFYSMIQLEIERQKAKEEHEKAKQETVRLQLLTEQQQKEVKRWMGAGEAAGALLEGVQVCLEKEEGSGVKALVDRSSNTLSLYIEPRSQTVADWFPGCSAALNPDAVAVVEQVRSCLIQDLPGLVNEYSAIVSIEGHTDARPTAGCLDTYPSNWELSGSRAGAVLRRMMCEEEGACPPDSTALVAATTLKQLAQDQRNLQIVSAGRASSRPAWRALCENLDITAINPDKDQQVCAVLEQVAQKSLSPEAALPTLKDILGEDVARWTTYDQVVVGWANYPECMSNKRSSPEADAACYARLGRLRRVDIRVDLRPKELVSSSTAAPPTPPPPPTPGSQ